MMAEASERRGNVVTITFPLPPNLANSRVQWAARLREKHRWAERAVAASCELRGRRPRRPWEQVCATALICPHTRMDDDNAVARLKWCIDLLKERGWIVDDKRPHFTLSGIPEQRAGAKPPRVEITLERLG